jgi:endonuclease-8
VPDGDVVARTAATLDRSLAGREVTGASSWASGVRGSTLVGRRVETVEALGRHLVVRFEDGTMLHTHLRMTGSWDLYPAGAAWRRPVSQARLVLECGDRVAVCFNAPVVELVAGGGEEAHPALSRFGREGVDQPSGVDEVDEVGAEEHGRPPGATSPDRPPGPRRQPGQPTPPPQPS